MSALLMGLVWHVAGLGRSERDVLLALADQAHDDGTSARPGVPHLVWKLGLARSTVIGALRGLEGKGLIVPVEAGGGRGKFTEYELRLDDAERKEPFGGDSVNRPIQTPVNRPIYAQKGPIGPPETVRSSLARVEGENKTLEQEHPPSPLSILREAWLACSPPLIRHRPGVFETANGATAIKRALNTYPVEDVAGAIRNYAAVLASPACYWNHSWTFVDFLNRGLHKFVDEARPLENFRTGGAVPGRVDPGEMMRRAVEERRREQELEEERG